ncbi:MAG: HAMP domain-containing histidine kinase, partial [Sphaerochaetaceae bacterium]|nr:HAMP domain-containing histidine kinase [Sphaerochaetaceae bacterium]
RMKKGKVGKLVVSGRDHLFVLIGLTIAFITLISLIIWLTSSLLRVERLSLINDVEKNFNSILFELGEGNTSNSTIMHDDRIIGVAVYNSQGSIVASWGSVYARVPSEALLAGKDTISFNKRYGIMEYTRFLRQPVVNAVFNKNDDLLSPLLLDFSSILYIAFDGSAYQRRVNFLIFVTVVVMLGLALLFFYILTIYRENRSYKEKMVTQENLVKLGQAARTLTHEIKNPLQAITLQIALLKHQLKDADTLDEVLLIEMETQRLVSLTNRVSDFLKKPEGNPIQMDLVEVTENLINLFSNRIEFAHEGINHAMVLFDPDRLRSVIENLIKNATESAKDRDPKVEVQLSLRKGMYHLFVMDRGDGLPKEGKQKLFDPFFTTKIHGSGIGLSISKQFLNARGGDIKLYDREGGGTVAEVTFVKYSLMEELKLQGDRVGQKLS